MPDCVTLKGFKFCIACCAKFSPFRMLSRVKVCCCARSIASEEPPTGSVCAMLGPPALPTEERLLCALALAPAACACAGGRFVNSLRMASPESPARSANCEM